jgi:hypothetical protein
MNIQLPQKGEKPIVAITLQTILGLDVDNKSKVAAVQAQGGNVSRIVQSLIKGAKTKGDCSVWEALDSKLEEIGFVSQADRLKAAYDKLPESKATAAAKAPQQKSA